MDEENKKALEGALLRQKAEELLLQKHAKKKTLHAKANTEKLIHELEVHQIELEMQNDELQLANARVKTVSEKFTALYDFAPSGYFTLCPDGKMNELNLHGAKLLGKERSHLVNKNFRLFITHETLPIFDKFVQKAVETTTKQTCEIRLKRQENPSIFVYIEGIVSENEKKLLVTAVDITEHKQAEKNIKQIEWLLTQKIDSRPENFFLPAYGDLAPLNTSRVILDSIGPDMLIKIAGDYLNLLQTSGAIYEANGDYALGIFSSGWCKFLDDASYKLCGTDDNRTALWSGKWLCHESCWNEAAKVSIEKGEPVDIECNGGLHLYAIPIRAGSRIVGSMNFGFGNPPNDPVKLREIADKYRINIDQLREYADAYETRPPFFVELAKERLQTSALLIGEIIERKQAEGEIKSLNNNLEQNVKKRTTQLEAANKELEKFNNLFVGREYRIKELREKVKELEAKMTK